MEPIKDTVMVLMENLQGKRKSPSGDSPAGLLKRAFSHKELKHLSFSALKKGTLHIKVDSATWLYYLNLRKQLLLDKLAGQSAGVKDIHFSIGDIKAEKAAHRQEI